MNMKMKDKEKVLDIIYKHMAFVDYRIAELRYLLARGKDWNDEEFLDSQIDDIENEIDGYTDTYCILKNIYKEVEKL